MKKYLSAFGIVLTSLAMVGCSGTPDSNQATLNSGDGESASKAAAIPLAADAETVRIGSIDWYVKYEDALADAKRTNRPVWLHFGENPG